MILAAGLTPAWQQIMCFDTFRVGEVNRAAEVYWCASGKVTNVALALKHLGAESHCVIPLGGRLGEAVDRELDSLAIARSVVRWQQPTRVCTTILDRQSGRTTELVQNAAPVTAAEIDALRSAFLAQAPQAKLAILTGSLPPGAPQSIYRELLAGLSCPAILDVRGPELLEALAERPFLVKPNREELAATFGRPLDDDAALAQAIDELHDRGARWVVITAGARPAIASGQGTRFRIHAPRVNVVNPIGSGDCLAAGIACGLAEGRDAPAAIRLGIAAAVENVTQLLPCRLDPLAVRARAETLVVEEL